MATRTVSASDLEVYSRCPARWLIQYEMHLPREYEDSVESDRGRLIHKWLEIAHARGFKCSAEDLPDPSTSGDPVAGLFDFQYRLAHPYLAQHLRECPLNERTEILHLDSAIYTYDRTADVVIASKPDLILRENGLLVIRETKTTSKDLPDSNEEAYDRWFVVPWLITLLDSDIATDMGTDSGILELEVLGPEGARVFAWDLSDEAVTRMARADVLQKSLEWHTDDQWEARPGRQCSFCPVRRWCPSAAEPGDEASAERVDDEPAARVHDDPPF